MSAKPERVVSQVRVGSRPHAGEKTSAEASELHVWYLDRVEARPSLPGKTRMHTRRDGAHVRGNMPRPTWPTGRDAPVNLHPLTGERARISFLAPLGKGITGYGPCDGTGPIDDLK